MAKIKLAPDATFVVAVNIPRPGDEPAPVKFTFKHRTQTQMAVWGKELSEKTNTDAVMEMASGWDLDDEFNSENVERLLDGYGGASGAILDAYLANIYGARSKN